MAAFVSRYASAFLDVVTEKKLDASAIDAQLNDFLGTWEGSSELREFVLPYADVRTAEDPDAVVARFLDRVHRAASVRWPGHDIARPTG